MEGPYESVCCDVGVPDWAVTCVYLSRGHAFCTPNLVGARISGSYWVSGSGQASGTCWCGVAVNWVRRKAVRHFCFYFCLWLAI